jgi:hypothetical protein
MPTPSIHREKGPGNDTEVLLKSSGHTCKEKIVAFAGNITLVVQPVVSYLLTTPNTTVTIYRYKEHVICAAEGRKSGFLYTAGMNSIAWSLVTGKGGTHPCLNRCRNSYPSKWTEQDVMGAIARLGDGIQKISLNRSLDSMDNCLHWKLLLVYRK